MPVAPEHVQQLVQNLATDPFALLGPHDLGPETAAGHAHRWSIRAFLPRAEAVWLVRPDAEPVPMQAVHHPHFFECEIASPALPHYRLHVRTGDRDRLLCDPYAFRAPYLSDLDLHLFAEGKHPRIYEKLGAHPGTNAGVAGTYFAVWAPNARNVSVLGDFNDWDGRQHQMRQRRGGIWELFVPEVGAGDRYKYEIKNQTGHIYEKSDPYGFQQEVRPRTASIVTDLSAYEWQDAAWLDRRRQQEPLRDPVAVYEVHLGSWMHAPATDPPRAGDRAVEAVLVAGDERGARFLTYRELADRLIPYVCDLGFTHIELMPIAEHPLDASWGYQVTGYYAPTSRFGPPEDFMYFVDRCHQAGLGVILDWVPGHFPKDGHGLAYFDGTHLYEYADPRQGEHREWGTLVFDYGRNEVRNFLVANALFWSDKYHVDGIRADAVASMLYLDYHRPDGEWLPNQYGGREHLDAVACLQQINLALAKYYPETLAIAEESSAWEQVSGAPSEGGLGFDLKWDMGWMHDTLDYFQMDPWFRQHHQNNITFGMWYFYNENYLLALSHDEVVHGKRHLLAKMPGDEWQQFANLRALYAFMYARPGKKSLFAGMEYGQRREWNVAAELDWDIAARPQHQQLAQFVGDLNALYRREPALYERDFERVGFHWIDCSDRRHSVVSFVRRGLDPQRFVVVVCNFTPQPHSHYRIGVPEFGFYRELLNSDGRPYGGSNMGNMGGKWSDEWSYHNLPYSLDLCLPPLGVLILSLDRDRTRAERSLGASPDPPLSGM